MTMSPPISTSVIAAFLFVPLLCAQSDAAGKGVLTQSHKTLLAKKEAELASQQASVDEAKTKLALIREKIKKQDSLINDLTAALEEKEKAQKEADSGKSLPAGFLSAVTPRIVIIEGNKGNGTGFLCESGGEVWVYTAAHVLSGNTTISVRDSTGRTYRDFEYVECAEGVDLVRLKPKDASFKGLEIVSATEAPAVDDLIVAVGNSLGTGSLSGEPGRILSIGDDMWELDAEIIPGNSGGPVLSLDTGKVVGIVTHLIIYSKGVKDKPNASKQVKRYAARLDKEWEWRKMPIARFVKEWQHIETMERDSSIAWASVYLMLTGPEAKGANTATDPALVEEAEAILARDRNHFQVQRVHEWLKRFRAAGHTQFNALITEGNKIIDRNLEEIRLKENAPNADDFSWYHRRMFEEQTEWRERLTKKNYK
jgi:serine protease Do